MPTHRAFLGPQETVRPSILQGTLCLYPRTHSDWHIVGHPRSLLSPCGMGHCQPPCFHGLWNIRAILAAILRGAHLIPVYGSHFIPPHFCHFWSLDAFKAFFVNKYADHYANKIAFKCVYWFTSTGSLGTRPCQMDGLFLML